MSGIVKSAEELYNPESMKECKKLVDDWGRKYTYYTNAPRAADEDLFREWSLFRFS